MEIFLYNTKLVSEEYRYCILSYTDMYMIIFSKPAALNEAN